MIFTFLLVVLSALGVQQPDPPLAITPLAPGVYLAQGGAGGNSGIIVGKTGVIVVDAKLTRLSAQELLAEIATITPKPVTHVILTHSDPDHVNGLAGFPAKVVVIAHEGAKREMEAATVPAGRGAASAPRLPTEAILRTGRTLTLEGVTIELHHWAPAHTGGDLVVYLPAQKIVFTGDIIATNRPDPLVRLEKHGSSEGWITMAKGMMGLLADTFVPGHGDVQPKAAIQARLDAAIEKRDTIAALIKEGKPLDAIRAAVGDPPSPAPVPSAVIVVPGTSGTRGLAPPPSAARTAGEFATFTEVVYAEMTRR